MYYLLIFLSTLRLTNKPILAIMYRKGSDNDADALSRRPYLQLQLEQHDMCTFEQALEEFQSHLSSMSHLIFDEKLLSTIREKSKFDPTLNVSMLPHGVLYSYNDNVYYSIQLYTSVQFNFWNRRGIEYLITHLPDKLRVFFPHHIMTIQSCFGLFRLKYIRRVLL